MGFRYAARLGVAAPLAAAAVLGVAVGSAIGKPEHAQWVPGCDAKHPTRGSWTGSGRAAQAAFYCYGPKNILGVIPFELVNKSDGVVLSVSLPSSAQVLRDDGAAAQTDARGIAEAAPFITFGCAGSRLGSCSLMPHHVLYFKQAPEDEFGIDVDTGRSEEYFVAFHVATAIQNKLATLTLRGKIDACARAVEAAHPNDPAVIANLTGILKTVPGCYSLYKQLKAEYGVAAATTAERAIDDGLHSDSAWARVVEELERVAGRFHFRP